MSIPKADSYVDITAQNSCNCFCFRMRKGKSKSSSVTDSPTKTEPDIKIENLALAVIKSAK